jgi:hypothetical protein
MMRSQCLAMQREPRNRGPTMSEQRAAAAAAEAAEAEERAAARARAPLVVASTTMAGRATAKQRPEGACTGDRGRAAMNAPIQLGGGVQNVEDRKSSLMEAAEFRPTQKVTSVAPTGAGKLDELPDRMEFEVATAAGAAAFSEAMMEFVDKNFNAAGIEARSADQHELKTGFFGFWHEKRGHGKCVEWVQVENGWELHLVKDSKGDLVVPTFAAAMEFAFLVRAAHAQSSWAARCEALTCAYALRQMAKGDKAKCPKGGWADYRNGEWFKQSFERDQGDLMTEENEGKYGHGSHKDEKYRFTTIEQKLSGIRKWYDKVCCNAMIGSVRCGVIGCERVDG